MKSKTFLILLVGVALLSAAAFFVLRSADRKGPAPSLGKTMLTDLPFDRISKIRIASHSGRVGLEKSPRGWGIAEKDGYPADFSKISELVEKLRSMKIGRRFEADDEIRSRLALYAPETAQQEGEAAVRVTLLDSKDRPLADLLIGSPRQSDRGFGGHYLARSGEDTVFLVDKTFKFMETDPAEWLHRQVVNLAPDGIKSVAFYKNGEKEPTYRLERAQDGAAFALTAAGVRQSPLKTSEVDRVAQALSPLRTDDVLPAENPGRDISFDAADRFEYRTEDGRLYAIELGPSFSKEEETFTFARLEKSTAGDGALDAEKGGDENPEKMTADSAAALDRWIYVLSDWKTKEFVRDPKKLVATEEKEEG